MICKTFNWDLFKANKICGQEKYDPSKTCKNDPPKKVRPHNPLVNVQSLMIFLNIFIAFGYQQHYQQQRRRASFYVLQTRVEWVQNLYASIGHPPLENNTINVNVFLDICLMLWEMAVKKVLSGVIFLASMVHNKDITLSYLDYTVKHGWSDNDRFHNTDHLIICYRPGQRPIYAM